MKTAQHKRIDLVEDIRRADTGEPCGVIEENTGSFGDRE